MPDAIRARRETVSINSQEPIRTFSRSAAEMKRSYYCNIPKLAVELLDIEQSDDLAVSVYRDKVVIRREDADE
jgi:hypothetical protein